MRQTLPSACMQQEVSRAGDRALLIDLGSEVSAAQLHAAAAAARGWAGVVACVVGHQTLYVVFDGEPGLGELSAPSSQLSAGLHRIEVSFADEYAFDLPAFLAHAGLTRDDFLAH